MIRVLIAVLLLAGCSSGEGGVSEEEAVQNIRENVTIDGHKTDTEVKEVMQNACDLFDNLGVPVVMLTMRGQGYSTDEAKALLVNSAAVYCPQHLEQVQKIGG